MNLLSVDTPVDPTITGLNSNNVLEIEDPVDVVVSGDQENLQYKNQITQRLQFT